MTAARLEELTKRCGVAIDGVGRNASYGLSADDLLDLARCARAWAKVEKALDATRAVTLHGVDDGAGPQWTWWSDDDNAGRAATAIEAVQAAEVKP